MLFLSHMSETVHGCPVLGMELSRHQSRRKLLTSRGAVTVRDMHRGHLAGLAETVAWRS